jgi:hypothetical protein
MASQLCQRCVHFLKVPTSNDEERLFFCGSEETKEGPQPIGFVRFDAPACSHFSSHSNVAKKGPNIIVITTPNVSQPVKTRLGIDEGQIIKWIVSLAAIVSVFCWAASHIAPQISSLPFWAH